ncbi:DNA primase DnaG [Halodesulfurarchaeum formicicum]|uniref:DNA primase DnaG n=1 Tax=Halodesulfurarchaeum formicicum TaxID=1873524 RepID=A0A1J1AAT8_9EURY|nr:DNA primase DnaG [Halodesulfurarchaeum formicicum]APE94847.1 DNA primase [Halodesulfurarchaeum formicicum]
MEDTAKYLIHAGFVADGVIERSDVVGAVFGQTEGLLGDELELRDLQESSKLGRIDVEVRSEGGTSRGTITIASSLDRVETATLAAALEAIDRIGPSQATVEIDRIEDVRAAKRREVVERAKELLATAFDEQVMDSRAILEEVRESIRVGDIIEYEGLPAGPNVAESDAVIVVEGRADVRTLLRYGIKNAIAVEGTDVPEAVAALTREKTATAFLDGDRGGDLIREELMQVGELDYVALSPPGRSVEDLSRHEVHTALQEKVPVEALERERSTESDSATASQPGSSATDGGGGTVAVTTETVSPQPAESADSEPDSETTTGDTAATLAAQIEAVSGSESARVLDAEFRLLESGDLDAARSLVRAAGDDARTVLVDGSVAQPLLDVAAKHGVTAIYGTGEGDIVKQPASVRIRSLDAS